MPRSRAPEAALGALAGAFCSRQGHDADRLQALALLVHQGRPSGSLTLLIEPSADVHTMDRDARLHIREHALLHEHLPHRRVVPLPISRPLRIPVRVDLAQRRLPLRVTLQRTRAAQVGQPLSHWPVQHHRRPGRAQRPVLVVVRLGGLQVLLEAFVSDAPHHAELLQSPGAQVSSPSFCELLLWL